QRLEDVVIDGVIVTVLDPAAQRAGQFRGDDLHARLDQTARHEELLSPGVAPVAFAHPGTLSAQVERLSRLAAGEEAERLPLKAVHRLDSPGAVEPAAKRIQVPVECGPRGQLFSLARTGEADVRHT